jgi:hypothetical protein
MASLYTLPSGNQVTRSWSAGRYVWSLHTRTGDPVELETIDLAALLALVDPVVADALLQEERAKRRRGD